MTETKKQPPESVIESSKLLGALEALVKNEGYNSDILLCYDEEDGFWLAPIERGDIPTHTLETKDKDVSAIRGTLAEAICEAVEWNNEDAVKRYPWRKRIAAPNKNCDSEERSEK